MLRQDPHLPFLDFVWSRQTMTDFFYQEVLPSLCPGQEVSAAVDKMTYTPGRKCVMLYRLTFGDGPRRPSRWAVATFAKDDRLQEVYNRHYDGHPLPSRGPGVGPAIYLPEYRCLVEFFPMDWELPALAPAMDPRQMAPLLAQALPDAQSEWSGSAQVEVIRYRPHESCVLCYRLNAGFKEAVGKLYRDELKAERTWRALNDLHSQAAAAGVRVPQALAKRDGWNLVLMEAAPGTSMKRLLKEAPSSAAAKRVAQLAARALAGYHGLHFESDEVRSIETELRKLRKRSARLHLVAPDLAEGVDVLLERFEVLAERLAPPKPSLVHGDCKPSQLLIDGDHVAVVDFDRAGLGDPAIDVGNFMAQFHKKAATGQSHLRPLSEYFLGEYQSQAPRDGLAERARLFQAISLLRMTVREFEASPDSYAQKGPSSPQVLLLREAAECLARL